MKCPVPGCDNDRFDEGQPFCTSCGLLGLYRGYVTGIVGYWKALEESPYGFCRYYAELGTLSRFLRNLFQGLAELEDNYITVGEIARNSGIDLAQLGLDPNRRARATDSVVDLYSTVRNFRISHPHIPFFRCWFCDIKGLCDALLMPPMSYAHSSLDDDYLRGFRPDYQLHWQLKVQRDRVRAINIPKPERTNAHVARLSRDMAGFRGVGNEYMSQLADWQRAASQADDAENARLEQSYYRALEDQRRDIADLERRMSEHPTRPDARSHKPCPNCGMMFPFVLRPLTDNRYMNRSHDNFNRPLTWIEFSLWGTGDSPQVAEGIMDSDPKDYYACRLMSYAVDSGAAISPLYMLMCELTYGPIDWE